MGLFDDPNGIDWGLLASGTPTPAMPRPPVVPSNPFPVPGIGANGMIGQDASAMPSMQSPISPEFLASQAAAQGIPPPPVDLAPSTNVGAALTGQTVPVAPSVPLPVPRPAEAPTAAANANASTDKTKPNDLANVLKNVTMPKAPETQKISTPGAPRVSTAIKGGGLEQLLLALNAAPGAGGIKLPTTLGQAFGRG